MRHLRIASRQSPLALWQAEYVKGLIHKHHPLMKIEIIPMQTQGDKILDTPLAKIGGKGLFVKELENAILSGEADMAVHSMKDVPMELPEGLHISAIVKRDDPLDALVSNKYKSWADLPAGAVIGTSSLRRVAQLKANRPDLIFKDLRGNVGTRLSKLDAGDYDAIVLAAAGLKRLGMENRITEILKADICLPAVGQGALGIESRTDDAELEQILNSVNEVLSRGAAVNDTKTAICVRTERAYNTTLMGGCQVPIAGYAEQEGDQIWLRGRIAEPDGSKIISDEIKGGIGEAEELGQKLATRMLAAGGKEILDKLYQQQSIPV